MKKLFLIVPILLGFGFLLFLFKRKQDKDEEEVGQGEPGEPGVIELPSGWKMANFNFEMKYNNQAERRKLSSLANVYKNLLYPLIFTGSRKNFTITGFYCCRKNIYGTGTRGYYRMRFIVKWEIGQSGTRAIKNEMKRKITELIRAYVIYVDNVAKYPYLTCQISNGYTLY